MTAAPGLLAPPTPGPMGEVPWQLSVPLADVYLVGYGNRLPHDFTLEMLGVLKRSARVFGLPPIHAPELGLAPMESLMGLYRTGNRRADIHSEIARTVIAAARDAPVALATYGSAMVGMPACHETLERAAQCGLSAHVTAAPSSLDGIWAICGLDPLAGTEIWDATTFVQSHVKPAPGTNLLLAQVGLMELPGVTEPVASLRDALLHFYDADHEVHFVTAAGAWAPRPFTESRTLGELARGRPHALSTLLVPASARPHAPSTRAPTPTRRPRQLGDLRHDQG